jgi:hypothetical protein
VGPLGVPDAVAVAVADAGAEAWGDGEGEGDDGGLDVPQPAASTPAAASAASRIVSFILSPAEGVAARGAVNRKDIVSLTAMFMVCHAGR